MKNGKIILLVVVVLALIVGLIYWNIKTELSKFCFSGSIKNFDTSNLSLIQGKNTALVDFSLVVFNKSNTELKIRNANFVIYYQGEKIGESIEPFNVVVPSKEIKEVEFTGKIYVTSKIVSVISSYLLGQDFEVDYIVEAVVFGIPVNKTGKTTISKNNQLNPNCI